EAGQAEHDETRLAGAQCRVVEPPIRHCRAAEIVGPHVAPPRQVAHQRYPARIGEIDRQAALAAVEIAEHAAATLGPIRHVDAFHLDHIRAVIGEHAGRHRPGNDPSEIEYADAAQYGSHV